MDSCRNNNTRAFNYRLVLQFLFLPTTCQVDDDQWNCMTAKRLLLLLLLVQWSIYYHAHRLIKITKRMLPIPRKFHLSCGMCAWTESVPFTQYKLSRGESSWLGHHDQSGNPSPDAAKTVLQELSVELWTRERRRTRKGKSFIKLCQEIWIEERSGRLSQIWKFLNPNQQHQAKGYVHPFESCVRLLNHSKGTAPIRQWNGIVYWSLLFQNKSTHKHIIIQLLFVRWPTIILVDFMVIVSNNNNTRRKLCLAKMMFIVDHYSAI